MNVDSILFLFGSFCIIVVFYVIVCYLDGMRNWKRMLKEGLLVVPICMFFVAIVFTVVGFLIDQPYQENADGFTCRTGECIRGSDGEWYSTH